MNTIDAATAKAMIRAMELNDPTRTIDELVTLDRMSRNLNVLPLSEQVIASGPEKLVEAYGKRATDCDLAAERACDPLDEELHIMCAIMWRDLQMACMG